MQTLPDDVEQLKSMLLCLQKQYQAVHEENLELKLQVKHLLEQLNLSKSKRFAPQSEKRPKGTFNEAEQQSSISTEKEKGKKGRKPLPASLPRENVEYKLDEPVCDCCGYDLHPCGSETTEELKIIPQKVSVIRHERIKYACRHCERTEETSKIITAPKPAKLIPKSIASPEALAAIATAKYVDALPLYRIEAILARIGVEISRTTLANWCVKMGEKLMPFIEQLKSHLLAQEVICADETTVQVLDEPGKTAESKSYMWVYRSGEYEPCPVVIYDYQPSRAATSATAFLGEYQGYLLTDGYQAYQQIEAKHAGCWAHTRRYFIEAQQAQPKKKVGRAEKALNFIGRLYGIERKAKMLSCAKRKAMRQKEAKPILQEFYLWLKETEPSVLPKSALGKAVIYILNQWDKLQGYLEDGRISIDNNVTERDIRPFTTGRKNWLFSKSVNGAKASANLYSLVMTCRANDINPYYYFLELFRQLPSREENSDLSDLFPWNIKLSDAV